MSPEYPRSYGGWRLNSGYYILSDKPAANGLSADDLKTIPFFHLDSAAALAEANGSQYAEDNRTKLLAEAFPALTLAAGGPSGQNIEKTFLLKNIINMQDTYSNGWPEDRENRDDYRWLHSDIREVSYVFINELFNAISRK